MIRLVIEDTDVDVLQTETIVGEYAIAPIGDISKRVGAKSIQFKLPKTTTNKALFESSELASSYSNMPYHRLKCRIYVDGVDMQMLFCILESVDEYYNIRMFGLSADFFNNLKDKKLADLDLRWLNHHWEIGEVNRFTDITLPLKYPVIDYNIDSPNDAINDTDSQIYIGTLYPVVEEHFLIEECCTQNGYTLENRTKDAPIFADNIPVIPLGSRKWERDLDGDRYLGEFTLFNMPSTSDIWLVQSIVGQRQIYYQYGYNIGSNIIQYTYLADQVKMKIHFKADFDCTPPVVIAPIVQTIEVVYADGLGGYIVAHVINIPITSGVTNTYEEIFEFSIGVLTPAAGAPWGFRAVQNSFYAIMGTNASFEVLECEILKDTNTDILYNPIQPHIRTYITVASNLPDFSQADFMKAYLQKTNSICYVDERHKSVLIVPFEIVKNDLTNAVDWSGKVDYKDTDIVTFDLGYAQHNYLKYKDDTDVIKPTGTDKDFQLNDNTLEVEKTIVTVPYSATESVSRLGGILVPKINSFENYLVKKEFKPRCLLMKYASGSFMYRKNQTNTTDAIAITTNIPYCHFILDTEEFNYGFGNSLFNEFWLYIIGVIDKAKVFNVPMQLSTLDIINFDFLKAVYIAELDSHFYVSKIKFDYTSRKSSIVELIKLL